MKKVSLILAFLCLGFVLFGQEETKDNGSYTDLGADLVSKYIWRGLIGDDAPNIQGWGEYGIGNFSVGVWASANFTGTFAETDLYAKYDIGNFSIIANDYFIGWDSYFNLKNDETVHAAELELAYTVSEKIPLQIKASVLVFGDDKVLNGYTFLGDPIFDTKNNFSTYFELMYPLTHQETEIELIAGIVTHESYFYDTKGFALVNVGIGLSKEIKITDDFKLPVSFSVISNPSLGSIYSVFGISF